jgi:hypothetical protein
MRLQHLRIPHRAARQARNPDGAVELDRPPGSARRPRSSTRLRERRGKDRPRRCVRQDVAPHGATFQFTLPVDAETVS